MKKSNFLLLAAACLTLLLCAAVCASAVYLYADGVNRRALSGAATEPVFTPEAVARQGVWFFPLLGLWLIAVAAAALGGGKKSREKARTNPVKITQTNFPRETGKTRAVRAALLVLSAALIALGVLNGGLNDVLAKAVHICTECIGLG